MSKKPARLHNKKPCAGTGWRTEQQTLCSYGTLDDYLDPNAVIDYVKDNMSDSTLSTEKMSLHLGVSRVHLYRKLKALTNQVPTEFIRTLRLKQAAYLLSQKKLNVSEIAYKVGFNSHQYFTNCFQKHFNMSPSEYSKQNESGEAGFKS